MGTTNSRPEAFVHLGKTSQKQRGESVFSVALDEKIFSDNFFTDLFLKQDKDVVKPLELPDENMILDVITNPYIFTAVNSSTQTWEEILTYIFISTDETKLYRHQIFNQFFNFLTKRSNDILLEEDKKNSILKKKLEVENAKALSIHKKLYSKIRINPKDVLDNYNYLDNFLQTLVLDQSYCLFYNSSYGEYSDKIISKIHDVESSYKAIMWGFASADLNSVIRGIIGFVQYLAKNKSSASNINFDSKIIAGLLENYCLNDVLTYPKQTTSIGDIEVPNLKFDIEKIKPESNIVSDGHFVFILGQNNVIIRISLSENICEVRERFSIVDLPFADENKTYITISNGYLVLGSGRREIFYKTDPFERIEEEMHYQSSGLFKATQKITVPNTSDGKYIYCLHGDDKINVFSIQEPNIVFHKQIELHETGKELLPPFNKKAVSKQMFTESVMVSNGLTVSFLYLAGSDKSSYRYNIRTFSLIDGGHIFDSVSDLKHQIVSTFCDPWNNCYWSCSPTKTETFLAKYLCLGPKPPWISGINLQFTPSVKCIKDKCTSSKDPVNFLDCCISTLSYIVSHFPGISFKLALTAGNYTPEMPRFLAPFTSEFILTLNDAINIPLEYIPEKLRDTYINMILALLQINLSNMSSLEENIEAKTLDTISRTLFKYYENDNFKFMRSALSFIFITSFPLIFKDRISQAASIFHTIFTEMSGNFTYWSLLRVREFGLVTYCYTPSSCLQHFSKLFNTLISNPANLTSCERFLLSIFQYNLLLETRSMYQSSSDELTTYEEQLQETFIGYTRLIFAVAKEYFENDNLKETNLKSSEFIRLFRRCLMLLQPLALNMNVSKSLITQTKDLYIQLLKYVHKSNSEFLKTDKKALSSSYELLFEVLALLVNFLNSVLNGGQKVSLLLNYIWLVKSISESKIDSKTFPDLCKVAMSPNSSNKDLINIVSKGITLDAEKKLWLAKSMIDSSKQKNLLKYLYTKVHDILNKKITEDIERIDAVVLMALAKQFGFISELYEINDQVSKGQSPKIFPLLKRLVNGMYDVRHKIRNVKQNVSPEEYKKFCDSVVHKSIFLLSIPPITKQKSKGASLDKLKAVVVLLSSNMIPGDCFNLIKESKNVSANLVNGFKVIEEIATYSSGDNNLTFLIDHLLSCKQTINILSEVMKKNFSEDIVSYISKLLSKFVDIIGNSKNETNILIVFFGYLLMWFGLSDFKSALKHFKQIILKLIETNKSSSYIAFICSIIYSLVTDNFSNDQVVLDALSNLTLPDSSYASIFISRFYLITGAYNSVNRDRLFSIVKKFDVNYIHSGISAMFYILLYDEKKRDHIMAYVLDEISAIASGSKVHTNSTYIPDLKNGNSKSKRINTPSFYLCRCLELIKLVRKCLLDPKLGPYTQEIFTYILNRQSNVKSAKHSNKSLFNSEYLLYGVFAVLSNTIEVIAPYTQMKNTTNNDVFYVLRITKSHYEAYKLPILAESVLQKIDFSKSFVPLCELPFKPSMYKNHEALLQYFIIALTVEPTSYAFEALKYYILSSLNVYLADSNFLSRILNTDVSFELSKFSMYSSSYFVVILRRHLANDEEGFTLPQSNAQKLFYCSQAHFIDNSSFSLTEKRVSVKKYGHSFISDVLTNQCPTYFQIKILNGRSFHVGIHCFALHVANSQTILYCPLTEQISSNGCFVTQAKSSSSINSFTLEFDPSDSRFSIITSNDLIFKIRLDSNDVCFVLHTEGDLDLSYELGILPPPYINMTNATSMKMCPAAGNIVFTRSRQTRSYEYECDSPFEIQTPPFQYLSGVVNPFLYEEDPNINPPVSYPPEIIKNCGNALNISRSSEITPQALTLETTGLHRTSNAGTVTNTTVCKKISAIGCAADSFPPTVSIFKVNDYTGEIAPDKEENFIEVKMFKALNCLSYKILPTPILNYFATGYTFQLRTNSINSVFIRSITSPQIGVEKSLEIFNVTLPMVLEYMLSMLTYLEPFNIPALSRNDIPIKFTYNLLSSDLSVRSSLHIYKRFIEVIMDYVDRNKLFDKFLDYWIELLNIQFSQVNLHFVNFNHNFAVVTQLSNLNNDEPRVLTSANSEGFLVFRNGFSPIGNVIIKGANGQEVKLNSGIQFLNTTTINVMLGDATVHGLIALPIFNNNESIQGTFQELIVNLKYIVYFINKYDSVLDTEKVLEAKSKIYCWFIDSYIGKSPAFVQWGDLILEFLSSRLPINTCDLVGELVTRLSILSAYTGANKKAVISHFLGSQQSTWDEKTFDPLKKYFKIFKFQTAQSPDVKPECIVPNIILPRNLDANEDLSKTSHMLMRLMTPRQSIDSFPFHLVMREWAYYSYVFPQFIWSKVNDKTIKIELKNAFPKQVQIEIKGPKGFKKYCQYSFSLKEPFKPIETISSKNKVIYIRAQKSKTLMNEFNIYLHNKNSKSVSNYDWSGINEFVAANSEAFVSDMILMFTMWDMSIDSEILSCDNVISKFHSSLKIDVPAKELSQINANHSLSLLCIRYLLLVLTNWLLYIDGFIGSEISIRSLSNIMPLSLKTSRFSALINDQSNDDQFDFVIDRKASANVRIGLSTDLTRTLIYQITKLGKDPRKFRRRGPNPMKITFVGEEGVDEGGGICREFIVETIQELTLPNTGLFIPTPNARDDVGEYRECFVPFPSSRQTDVMNQFWMIGVLIGVSIRSGIVQDFNLAPFIWDYLATGELSIEGIYQIDENYKRTIKSLELAVKSHMDEETFASRFDLRFVVLNSAGDEIQLTQLGRFERVTLANCQEYISLAHEFRLSEFRDYISAMRKGLWENLNFRVPCFVTGDFLRVSACGHLGVPVENILRVTKFDSVPEKMQKIFKDVITSFDDSQRSAFLKFSTGRVKLPAVFNENEIFLHVTMKQETDKLPSASTCYNQFQMPMYTSFEKAYNMILKAITFTATFDLR